MQRANRSDRDKQHFISVCCTVKTQAHLCNCLRRRAAALSLCSASCAASHPHSALAPLLASSPTQCHCHPTARPAHTPAHCIKSMQHPIIMQSLVMATPRTRCSCGNWQPSATAANIPTSAAASIAASDTAMQLWAIPQILLWLLLLVKSFAKASTNFSCPHPPFNSNPHCHPCTCGYVGHWLYALSPCRTPSSVRMSKLPKAMPSEANASVTLRLNPQRGASGVPCSSSGQ